MNFEQVSTFIYDDISFAKNSFEEKIDTLFNQAWDEDLIKVSTNLKTAFIHKSFKHENSINLDNNERLEFLGDSVLQLMISDYLMKEFPNAKEGDLSKLRSRLVNEKSLAALSKVLGFGRWILLGKGELKEQGFKKDSILSDCFEAVLGSVYLDDGLKKAEEFLFDSLRSFKKKNKVSFVDYAQVESADVKSLLQEKVMKKYKKAPEYLSKSVSINGKDMFEVEVKINNKVLAKETMISKKKAIQALAKKVLDNNLV